MLNLSGNTLTTGGAGLQMFHYFMLYNEYVDGAGQPNTLRLYPANLPVHVVP